MRKEAFPANKATLVCWEETTEGATVNKLLLPETTIPESIGSCDAWGERIEKTLLLDLSEEERDSVAEHMKMCSACAARFRQYQIIEEFAGNLLQYDLVGRKTKHRKTVARKLKHLKVRKEIPRETRTRSKETIILLLLCLPALVAILAWILLRGSRVLLVVGIGLVMAAATVTIVQCRG